MDSTREKNYDFNIQPTWPRVARAYVILCDMKQLQCRSIATTPGWDASQTQDTPLEVTYNYPWIGC